LATKAVFQELRNFPELAALPGLTNGPYQISEIFNAIQMDRYSRSPIHFRQGRDAASPVSTVIRPTPLGKIHQFNVSVERRIKDIGLDFLRWRAIAG
jgi:hypothetical protein